MKTCTPSPNDNIISFHSTLIDKNSEAGQLCYFNKKIPISSALLLFTRDAVTEFIHDVPAILTDAYLIEPHLYNGQQRIFVGAHDRECSFTASSKNTFHARHSHTINNITGETEWYLTRNTRTNIIRATKGTFCNSEPRICFESPSGRIAWIYYPHEAASIKYLLHRMAHQHGLGNICIETSGLQRVSASRLCNVVRIIQSYWVAWNVPCNRRSNRYFVVSDILVAYFTKRNMNAPAQESSE